MHTFEYLRPSSVAEAIEAFRGAADGKFLAGGMTLIPIFKQWLARPTHLIDLSRIQELDGIHLDEGGLVIGAMTKHSTVAGSPEVQRAIPALAMLAASIGDPQVRNRGTLGGSIANNDPAADYPAAVVALGATIVTDRRRISADSFFSGIFETVLEPDELVVAVVFPIPVMAGYAKVRQTASRYALVGVMVSQSRMGARVAVVGAGPNIFRQIDMEAALDESFSPEALEHVRTREDGLNADMHGSAEYRAHLVDVIAKRAVTAACMSAAHR
jgi:aerobic carbon-monoxide dehydrogenase medium subunit